VGEKSAEIMFQFVFQRKRTGPKVPKENRGISDEFLKLDQQEGRPVLAQGKDKEPVAGSRMGRAIGHKEIVRISEPE
jgi:hypothetical protein